MGFEDKIAAMVPRYLTRAETRIDALRESLTRFDPDIGGEGIAEARIVLHDIAGTAPVLGLSELGALARKGDDLALRLSQSAAPPDAATLTELRSTVERLWEEVSRAGMQ